MQIVDVPMLVSTMEPIREPPEVLLMLEPKVESITEPLPPPEDKRVAPPPKKRDLRVPLYVGAGVLAAGAIGVELWGRPKYADAEKAPAADQDALWSAANNRRGIAIALGVGSVAGAGTAIALQLTARGNGRRRLGPSTSPPPPHRADSAGRNMAEPTVSAGLVRALLGFAASKVARDQALCEVASTGSFLWRSIASVDLDRTSQIQSGASVKYAVSGNVGSCRSPHRRTQISYWLKRPWPVGAPTGARARRVPAQARTATARASRR